MVLIRHPKKILLYYQCMLALAAIIVFFTNLDSYLFDSGLTPKPLFIIYGFTVAAIPLFLSLPERLQYIPKQIIFIFSIYICVSLISFNFSHQSEVISQTLDTRIRSVYFYFLMTFIFSGNKTVLVCVKCAIVVILILNVINNCYELINPWMFSDQNTSGRPAGFYVNPNRSGCALMLGIILCTNVLPSMFRLLFAGICGFGIFLTFSRGALLSLPIIIAIFTMYRIIPRQQLFATIVAISIIITSVGFSGDFLIQKASDLGFEKNVSVRLETIFHPSSSDANDDTSRLDIIPFALQKFYEKPLFGHGIGYTEEWGQILPHNMYLLFLVEHGFLGALILPFIVLSVIQEACGETKQISHAFAIYILIWGIFSHNILDERFILLSFSFMTAMNVMSQLENKYKMRYKS